MRAPARPDDPGVPLSAPAADPTQAGTDRLIELEVLSTLGIELSPEARILDFGCGSGSTVAAFRQRGYPRAEGYDVSDGRTLSEEESGLVRLGSLLDLQLPYEDDTFDLITSDQVFEHVQDQVRVLQELHRITKPGGHQLHIIPARYGPIEGHIYVPFGGVLQHRWWYKLWATLGVRNEHQQGLTADEVADHNTMFVTDATRYVSNSCYRVVFQNLGYEYRFAEQEFFDGHPHRVMRAVGRLGTPAALLYRTFRSRVICLRKPLA